VQQRFISKEFRVGGFFFEEINSRGITEDHIKISRGEISSI
jgi:hypothetical protein